MLNQMNNMISIITPVYNGEKYLSNFIESILANTYQNWELLMIDDGSTDDSFKIILDYEKKDKRIKYIKSKHHNSGYSRNIGIDLATGEFMCFFDCDDYVKETFLEDMLCALIKHDADLVFCKCNAFLQDKAENKDMDWSFRKRFFPKGQMFINRDNCQQDLFQTNLIAAWNKMVRSSLVKDNHIYAQSIASANDVVLTCMMMALAKRIVPFEKVLYTQRRNNKHSITANLGVKNYMCGYLASKELHDELIKRNIYDDIKISYQKLAIHNCIWYLDKIEENPRLFKKQFRFLKKSGFRELDIENISNLVDNNFLDKQELQKYYNIKKMPINVYCDYYGIDIK